MRVLLRRFAEFGHEGTASHIRIGGWRCCGLELPWRDNQRNVSRVPAGLYALVPIPEKRTYYLVGSGVVRLYEEASLTDRWGIRFDIANTVDEILGCIAIGKSLGFLGGNLAVLESRSAMWQMLDSLSWDMGHELLIQDRFGGFTWTND
jgi:hypothetical protein